MADQAPDVPAKMTLQKKLVAYMRTGGKSLALVLAGRMARWVIIALALISVGWLSYGNVTQTLSQPVQLPLGITANNPELDANALSAINNARINRSQFQFKSFAAYDALFAPAVATPTPLP